MRRDERGVREALGAALVRGAAFVDAACGGKWRLWALGEAQLQVKGGRRGSGGFVEGEPGLVVPVARVSAGRRGSSGEAVAS